MRMNPYKLKLIKQDMIRLTVAFISITLIVVLITIITINNQSEQIYLEGIAKSAPLISKDTISRLGNLYIKLNREFEFQIKERETGYANRLNKRGDRIYYGVNGKENPDEMINEDYVNGIENIEYIKNKADREDGDSNFTDMITVINAILQSDVDRYDDKIDDIFIKLFWLSHTFTGESTELYPCEHGCSWCKYYCGDIKCQGEINGDIVSYYRCDQFMGESGKYGLMYDPFLITKRSNYSELERLVDSYSTIYKYNTIKLELDTGDDDDDDEEGDDEVTYKHVKDYEYDIVRTETIDLYNLFEPEGYCDVCSEYRETFTSTTKTFGGCINNGKVCHHGEPYYKSIPDSDSGYWIDWYINKKNKDICREIDHKFLCFNDGDNHVCKDHIIGCNGYYYCLDEGHEHYACPGHIIVTCFGHTSLRLKIKIMYYEEMLDNLKSIVDSIS